MIKTLLDIIVFFQKSGLIEIQTLDHDEINIQIITTEFNLTDSLRENYNRELATCSQKIWLSDLVDLIVRNSVTNEAEVLPLSFERVASMTATLDQEVITR